MKVRGAVALGLATVGNIAVADTAQDISDLGEIVDVLWLAVCCVLVFLMQAGFALLESGMVRAKNAINVVMKNYADMCVGAIGFWLVGYGLMFGFNDTGFLGLSDFAYETANSVDAINFFYQMLFAATAATIVSGALAERVRFKGYVGIAIFVTTIIYPVFGSWAWNTNGWLNDMGFVDFAGSTVVHSVGGWCALAGVLVLGPRLGRFDKKGKARVIPGHNLTLVGLSGFLLWFGWFGFNGGSFGKADIDIGKALLNTHMAGTAAVVGYMATIVVLRRKMMLTHLVMASVAGLVAITASAGWVSTSSSIIIGLVAGVIVHLSTLALERMGLDDAVGAIQVHGVCGAWGTLAVPLFVEQGVVNTTFVAQAAGVGACLLWTLVISLMVFVPLRLFGALRASTLHEQRGLDYSEHIEIGYPEFQKTSTGR